MESRRKEILCLCDDSNMLHVRRLLLEHFGYVVLPTTSVEDAKSIVRDRCPDMFLMDNSDSGTDFEQLAEHAKRSCPEVITVLLSQFSYSNRNGLGNAVDRVVAKDDGPHVLLAEIEDLFGEKGKTEKSEVRPA